jgi:hypothetical protein
MPSGQWMCAERRWMSSMIDMIVPSISFFFNLPGWDLGVFPDLVTGVPGVSRCVSTASA